MATIREGVMAKEPVGSPVESERIDIDTNALLKQEDFAVEIIGKTARKRGADLKSAKVIVAGGYGMGSAENIPKVTTTVSNMRRTMKQLLQNAYGRGIWRHCQPISSAGGVPLR